MESKYNTFIFSSFPGKSKRNGRKNVNGVCVFSFFSKTSRQVRRKTESKKITTYANLNYPYVNVTMPLELFTLCRPSTFSTAWISFKSASYVSLRCLKKGITHLYK